MMFPSVFVGLRLIFFKNRTVLHYKSSNFPNFHYHNCLNSYRIEGFFFIFCLNVFLFLVLLNWTPIVHHQGALFLKNPLTWTHSETTAPDHTCKSSPSLPT